MELCPCGSQVAYSECCGPLHAGEKKAETAEQLMRSRYSAYVKANVHYIVDTTAAGSRKSLDKKATRDWAEKAEWLGLQIVSTTKGGPEDKKGEVEFIASYKDSNLERRNHHEIGRFKKLRDVWYYDDGELPAPTQVVREEPKVGRNDPCPCGSGKKFKKCCAGKIAETA